MINEVIKQVNDSKRISKEDFAEVTNAIINAKNMNLIESGPDVDYIYYKEDEDYEYFVYKSDEEFGLFEVAFGIFDKIDCDNDRIETLTIESVRDFRAIVAAIARFDKDPFDFMMAFDECLEDKEDENV